uniref:Uncharacterized protein n=1 Tax=Parascaris univalens TaxID=6257 RepID=A0A915ALF0_PARUN
MHEIYICVFSVIICILQLTNLLTTAAARQSTSPAIHPFTPSPIRPTPTHPPTTRDDIPPSHSLLAATEMHYNETFNKTQGILHDSNDARSAPTISSHDHSTSKISAVESKSGDQDEQRSTTLHPQVMINLLNGVLSKVKSELHHQGVGVHLDATGRPIDFSARPVDPIFRRAREQLESSREYRDATSPSNHHINVDRTPRRPSFSLKEAEVVRLASERIQNTTGHPKANITSTEILATSNGKVINVGKSTPPQTSTSSSDSNTFNKQESGTSMSSPKSTASSCTTTTNTVVCADAEDCKSKEEKTSERSNEKTVLDDYGNDYSPDEKRLRIALIEEE